MIFADIPAPIVTPTGNQLMIWIGCASFVMFFAHQGLCFFAKLKSMLSQKPEPAEVQRESAEKFVAKKDFEREVLQNRDEHIRFDARIGGVDRSAKAHLDTAIEKLREERKTDMRQLHAEVNGVSLKVAALETEAKNSNGWLQRMDEKLDELTAR